MLKLASATPPGWGAFAARHLDAILLDHAHLEKKAAGAAVTLLFRYPEVGALQAPLAALAREELAHFEAVLAELEARGLAFGRHRPSPYAGRLREAAARDEPQRLVDALLCAAVIEARSCERLGLLAEALGGEPRLAAFYRGLRSAEARHHGLYVELACAVAPRAAVAERLATLCAHEAGVLRRAPVAPRLHDAAPEVS
jgi:tRNA-(ms[2]io[6]A)-hydroxylase